MAYRDKSDVLRGAISIYKRDSEGGTHNSENWYAAITIPGQKAIRRSLKTTSKDDAIQRAQSLHYELTQRAKRGLTLSPKLFEVVASRFLDHFSEQVRIWDTLDADGRSNMEGISRNRYRNLRPIVENYLIPFFSGVYIQEITDKDVDDYRSFRLGYWTSEEQRKKKTITYIRGGRKVTRPKRAAEKSVPSYSTINKELTALRKIFDFALRENLISSSEVPVFRRLKRPSGYGQKNERPTFTKEELGLLLDTIRDMAANQTNPKHALAHYRLYLYVQLMSFSGMRVSEAKNLRFSDTGLRNEGADTEHFTIWVRGKGKSRNVVTFRNCEAIIDRFRSIAKTSAKKNEWEFSEDMFVLSNEDGKPIGSHSTALSNALQKCNLLYAKNGKRRSASSFRSFYITSALASGLMTHIQLAVNCGTSVTVIEKYYNRMDPSNFPEKFHFERSATDTFFDHFGSGIGMKSIERDISQFVGWTGFNPKVT